LVNCSVDFPEIEVCLLEWHNQLQEAIATPGSPATPTVPPPHTATPAAPAGAEVGGKPVYGQQGTFGGQIAQAFRNLLGPTQRFNMAQKALQWLKASIEGIQKMNPTKPLEAPDKSGAANLGAYLDKVIADLRTSQTKLPQMVTGYTQGQVGAPAPAAPKAEPGTPTTPPSPSA
jgi:hypothetical protein